MARYHINPETGRPNQCTAKVKCRFGSEAQHFDTKEDARAGYEKQMASQTVSGSFKKASKTASPSQSPAPKFDSAAVKRANEEIAKISNGAVSIQLASDFMDPESTELIVAFNAEHDMCIVIEEEDGKKVAYTGYGPDPTRTRWPVSEYVTASRIDDLALENENYRSGGWKMEPSEQGNKIAKIINDVAAGTNQTPAAKVVPAKATPKAAPAVPAAPKPLAVIPGVPPVSTAQELNEERGELTEQLYGYKVAELLRARDIGAAEILEEERSGRYYVEAKVPSHYEVSISTDLARHELGLPPRPKTGIDEDPLRIAEIKKNEAYSKTFGSFTREESMAVNKAYKEARDEFYRIQDERRRNAK